MNTDLLKYYAWRVREYEAIYDRPDRQVDLVRVRAWLRDQLSGLRVVEVACGTGYWTAWLALTAQSILATDAVPEVLEMAKRKSYPPGRVRFLAADAYALGEVEGSFNAAFAGFFWSHVPRARVPELVESLHGRLGVGARVVLLDNRYVEGSSTPIARRDAEGNTYQIRRLADGTRHEVLKNFPLPSDIVADLGNRASELQIVQLEHYWCASYRVAESSAVG